MHQIDAKLAILKTEIALTRRKLNQAWAVNQKTDAVVLAIGIELDQLCNEYERLKSHRGSPNIQMRSPRS